MILTPEEIETFKAWADKIGCTVEEFNELLAMLCKLKEEGRNYGYENATIGQLVEDCAKGVIKFDELCMKVAAMGYKTTSLYEMVIATEQQLGVKKGGHYD